jgi:predicted RNase H-like HicB family nuclease
MYRVGFPGWKVAARLNVPMKFLVCIHRDDEAKVYFAHSPHLRGLTVEAATLEELREEVRSAATELLDIELHGSMPRMTPELRFNDTALCAA